MTSVAAVPWLVLLGRVLTNLTLSEVPASVAVTWAPPPGGPLRAEIAPAVA